MKIPTNPDILRNSTRSYRSYKEATGSFARFEEESNDRWNKLTIVFTILLVLVVIFIGE